MNKLHSLLESYADGSLLIDSELVCDDGAIDYHLVTSAKKAVCFFMGDVIDLLDLTAHGSGWPKLPFPVCWFEGVDSDNGQKYTQGFLVVETDQADGCIAHVLSFAKLNGRWMYFGVYGLMSDGSFGVSTFNSQRYAVRWGRTLLRFMIAMNCSNVSCVEQRPDDALQKARAKKGKLPLFSYWSLQLKGVRSVGGGPLGGTHESPRVHLRRGHPRQYAPGRWTWVQPCVVGSPERGMVHKDYDGSRLSGVAH